ncbi:MAG: AAA family ATPase [Lactobacillaceae bacterium]|jgi:chromosome partitioning protein|nr:AAA family ATPase [Lactobacillaceae bacterium]
MTKVIALANQKGGVGKTTSALNIAAGLSKNGKKILLVDLDPQANATSGSGIDEENIKKDTYDVLVGGSSMKSAILETDLYDIVPSSTALAGAEIKISQNKNKQTVLKNKLDKVKKNYDYVIIDNPPALGLLSLNSLTAADSILIPVQAEYFALEGLAQLSETIDLVKEHGNDKLEIEGVLMTMTSRTKLSKQVTSEVRKHFADKVYSITIPRNVRISEAPSFGKAIQDFAPLSSGARAYNKLIKEILKNDKKEDN